MLDGPGTVQNGVEVPGVAQNGKIYDVFVDVFAVKEGEQFGVLEVRFLGPVHFQVGEIGKHGIVQLRHNAILNHATNRGVEIRTSGPWRKFGFHFRLA